MSAEVATKDKDGQARAGTTTINLQVRYIGARQPFIDPKVDANKSLSSEKPGVLTFFNLAEGDVNGGTKTYIFARDGEVVDQSATIGALAQGKHVLKLDLLERFEQG